MTYANPMPRKGRKVAQVLDGARTVFLAWGYDRASVDDIAREAGVSKATLYSYFPDKQLLFREVARNECLRQAQEVMELLDPKDPPRKLLEFGARRMVEFFSSPISLSIFRMCVAQAERFPELGREFYENGPMIARNMLADRLAQAHACGDLNCPDPVLAAEQFAELCKTRIFTRRIFGIQDEVSDAEIELIANEAVETFLARYAPRPAERRD